MQPILDIADLAQRREAAEAVADGSALFYAFGNFAALAARPDLESLRAMNALKGRPADQVGSVTTTPEKSTRVFDWDKVALPWSPLIAVMADLHALGPIGFRGPAAQHIPDHLTVDGTVQLISPGDACPSNALVADALDLAGEDILSITSANASGHASAAHYEMRAIQREFGHRDDVTLIGHRNERAIRRQYPHHLPCSTSIVAFHTGELVLERLGSLDAAVIAKVAARHGLTLEIAPAAQERVPMRAYRRPLTSSSRSASGASTTGSGRFARRRRGRLTLISWAKK
jgi:tRNA A37 threonylcarbamoyladenosine synthetase subunit TsaC/SUA5/YrdC